MIIYFYLLIPLAWRLTESSSIKGRNHRNDLVPFLSSRPDTQKDNSLKIVSNEPFIIEFQVPAQTTQNGNHGPNGKDKKKKRPDKKRVSKIKPLRKKIRKRRSIFEYESRRKSDQPKKRLTEAQTKDNKTENSISRQEMIKALNMHALRNEAKNLKSEGMRNSKDIDKTDVPSRRNLHRNHSPPSPHPDRDPHPKMIYPNTPKSDSQNYSYKDLIADRERVEQKINYIKSMLYVNNDTAAEDAVRVRRKSDSDNTANKIAKMFLTLSAVNGLHDKTSKCHGDDDDRTLDIWEKDRKRSPTRQSSSSNEERYKVKKWIEYMKSKRSSSKTCPCIGSEYNDDSDVFPLEQKLATDYQLTGSGASSEETSDTYRDTVSHPRGKTSKSGYNRNSNKEDARGKLKALANRGRKKYELPIDDDLEVYRSRAKQILKNAEEILDKIKEEEEKRLAAPHAMMSRLRELTSRIQGDPRNNENDLIKIIQKNLGWTPQAKSKSDTDSNSFVENMKSLILDPYEKAKALTDESTRKLSSYLLRNLGKIDSSEEQEEATGRSDQSPQVYHGQVPQTEEMFSANLAKENPESDSLAKERAEHQNWSDTLSAILGGNYDNMKKESTQDGELKQIKDQEDPIKRRMEDMIKEQERKISEYAEKPVEEEESAVFDLMTEGQNITPEGKRSENSEKVAETFESEKQDNVEKSGVGEVPEGGITRKESETVKFTPIESVSDVTGSENQQTSDDETVAKEFGETTSGKVDMKDEDESQHVKASENEDLPIGSETVSEYLQNKKDLESAKAQENLKEKVKDEITESQTEFKEGTGEVKEQSVQSYKTQQMQDDNVESKENREENDVIKSKHLVVDDPERNTELEELTEGIKELVEENTKELSEENPREEKPQGEGIVMNKKLDSPETELPDENVREISSSTNSDRLQKQTDIVSENVDDDPPSNGYVEASQNSKLTEKEAQENSAESFVESEKTENSAERIIEKGVVENEKIHALEKTKLDGEEAGRRDDTLKTTLRGEEKIKDETEEIDEEGNTQNSNEGEILKESENEEQQGGNQAGPSSKTSLGESYKMQKSDELDEDETDQDKPSLRAYLEESDKVQKSSEADIERGESNQEPSLKASLVESEKMQKSGETEAELDESNQEPSLRASFGGSDKIQKSDEDIEKDETDKEPSLKVSLVESEKMQKSDEEINQDETDQAEPSLKASLGESNKMQKSDEDVEKDETDKEPSLKASLVESEKMQKSAEEDAELDESDQEPSLRASLEPDNVQKFSETLPEKSLEDEGNFHVDAGSLRSENPDFEKNSREQSVKVSKKSHEESDEVDQTENEEGEESKSKGGDEVQDASDERDLKATKPDNRENEEQLRAELTKTQEIDGANEESPLKLENLEKDTERSNESLMSISGSEEKVERADDESIKEKSDETERIVETFKATADEFNDSEEIASRENENVEEQQKENLKENSSEESVEVNETPKLLMRINGGLGEETMKESENENSEKTSTSGEKDAVERTNPSLDVSQGFSNLKTNEQNFGDEREAEEMDEDNNDDYDINVRSEHIQEVNNQIDDTSLKAGELRSQEPKSSNEDAVLEERNSLEREISSENDVVEGVSQVKEAENRKPNVGKKKNVPASEKVQNLAPNQSKSTLEVPKSIGKIMRDLSGKEKDGYISLTNLNPEKIDHIIDQIDEAEQLNKMESESVDCRKECACADEMNTRSRNIGRYEIAKDFLHWVKDLHLNRVLAD